MKSEAPTLHLPVVGLKDWLTGARPVAGAIGACSLMLLACSWFVFGTEHTGPGGDVGAPTPVRIDDTAPRDVGARTRAVPAAPAPKRAHAVQARLAPSVPRTPPAGPSVRPSQTRSAEPPATPVASPPAAPTSAAAPAQVQAPTPALPAPLDSPPTVTVPSISVSVPQVPGVPLPPVTVTTPPLGLP